MSSKEGLLFEQDRVEFSGIRASILLGGDSPFSVMELAVERRLGSPRHISEDEDKVFLVTSGRFVFAVGNRVLDVAATNIVYVPRGVEHSFASASARGEMVLVSSPAHRDQFFRAMAGLTEPHDSAEVIGVSQAYGQRITGPVVTIVDFLADS